MGTQWLVVSEAAEQLGVAESTVRRRAGRGELRSRRSNDGVLQVQVESDDAPEQPSPEQPSDEKPSAEAPPTATPPRAQANKAWAHLATATPSGTDDLSLDSVPDAKTDAKTVSDTVSAADADEGHAEASTDPPPPPPDAAPSHETIFPNLTMADIAPPSDGAEESEARRFQRLAGASLVMAQRQTDEANEKLAIVRHELHRARRWGQGVTAAAIFCAVMLLFSLITGGSDPQPAEAVSPISPAEQLAQKRAQLERDRELKATREAMHTMQQELTATLGKLQGMQENLAKAGAENQLQSR